LNRKVQNGEMTIKEYVRQVSQLKFFPGDTTEPSEMPTSDPFVDAEAGVWESMEIEHLSLDAESIDAAEKEPREVYSTALERGPNGLLVKNI
jgi:hypothetical protein